MLSKLPIQQLHWSVFYTLSSSTIAKFLATYCIMPIRQYKLASLNSCLISVVKFLAAIHHAITCSQFCS